MKFHRSCVARAALLCLSMGLGSSLYAAAPPEPVTAPVVTGERLSGWILRNAGPLADTTALQWRVRAERAPQERLKQSLLQDLRDTRLSGLSVAEREQLLGLLQAMPVTGRLNVSIADPRWLQGTPAQDPVLQDGHSVALYPRPTTVTVLSESAQPCVVTRVSGAMLGDYLRACFGTDAVKRRDWSWIAQSDGVTRRFGIAAWNIEPQDEPAPGAWIWAPSRSAGIPNSVSDNLARFLATQAPFGGQTPAVTVSVDAGVSTAKTPLSQPQFKASDWGEIGLLQTPTARMAPAGDVRLQVSRIAPYTRSTVMLQPVDWLEAGFRYTDVSNRLYGPDIAGTQTLKDKSIDIKVRLAQETSVMPQLAVGLVDLGGTGLFSSEYLVANKRWGNWDASLGLAWGYLGGRGNIKNPFALFGSKFDTRPANQVGQGGTTNTGAIFRGATALFGGIQWQSPTSPWTLKLELDGNDYQHEPQANNQVAKSPLNFGAVYTYSPNWDFSLAFERGNRFMLGMTFHGGLDRLYSPKLLDPALPSVKSLAAVQTPPAGIGNTAQNIEIYTGWAVRSITHQQAATVVHAEADAALYLQERLDRAVAVLHQDAPASSRTFVIDLQERGLPMSRIEVNRAEWVASHLAPEAPALHLPAQQTLAGYESAQRAPDAYVRKPGFSFDWGPSYSQILGGPDGFLLFQLGLQSNFEHRFSDNTWVSSAFDLRLIDNYSKFKFTGSSDLPRVRTYAREYTTTSRLSMPLLQLTHVGELAQNQYFSAYGGMLESMYGGIGAEWLYRPWQSRLAFGVDVNHVRQRDFSQNLSFRDYSVNTGHATLYWDTGWNDVLVKLSAGRYLAGDTGATLDVKRVFPNGVAMGAWATKTNVSAAQFGEGSFDKGIYVNIPFDAMLPQSSPSTANIIWNPLTRDGGARLNRRFTLFDLTKQRDSRALQWHQAKPGEPRTAQDASYVLLEPAPNIFASFGSTGTALGQQIADVPASTWLWAGGAILASSLLDKKVDNWAVNHQTPAWDRVGKVGNNLPIAMVLGAGMLYTGIAGEDSASTAETALKAGAYTIGASALTRFVVGRSRPKDNMGSSNFDGFNSAAFQSGFPSNHVALAFALATPFAQKNDMPWLYGVASLSALGRIQSRDHWLSDTVGGAFLGYAIGSMVGNQAKSPKDMRLSVTPRSVQADWAFD